LTASQAGNITLIAPKLILENQGSVNAVSATVDGGNVNLNIINLLLMRQNSQISASAGTAQKGGDGGNITIDTKFVIATPRQNNDITANAYRGKGGNIQINAQSILGLQARPKATLQTNDITASSQFGPSGTVTLNAPEIDPSRGLSPLPNTTVDLINQMNPNCSPKALANNSFTSVGKGGLPDNPSKPLQQQPIVSNWVKLNPQDTQPSTPVATLPLKPQPIVEAQGWRRESNGDIVLFAGTSSGTLPQPQPALGCSDR
jgi:large exoprotein involved in heme utilization and adhesion